MTPAERAQLGAILAQVEAMAMQAGALEKYATGLANSVAATLAGGTREGAAEQIDAPPAVRRGYLGGQELLEGSSKLVRGPRPVRSISDSGSSGRPNGERSHADPVDNGQPQQE